MSVQNVVVILVVSIAGLYVARTLWRMFNGRPTCGCGSNQCSQGSTSPTGRDVELRVNR